MQSDSTPEDNCLPRHIGVTQRPDLDLGLSTPKLDEGIARCMPRTQERQPGKLHVGRSMVTYKPKLQGKFLQD
jgi:hypothetical protein